MTYYRQHVFFCLNRRAEGEPSCASLGAEAAFLRCKNDAREARLDGVRVNRSGCLGRCTEGPVAVVYPDGVWYTYVDAEDVKDIVDDHLARGRRVERLLLGPAAGDAPLPQVASSSTN
jgi:(2Fe-2S) ferredoxin